MNKLRNQMGFAALELLLFAVIILGLGGISWYVINSTHKTQTQLDQLTKTSDNASKNTASASNKIVFKELGVQMTLPSTLKGLAYKEDNGYLYIVDDSFINGLKKCSDYKAGDTGGGFTAIGKKDGQYPTNPNPIDDGALLKQFPDFYINYGVPNGNACSDLSQSENLKKVSDNERNVFNDAFKSTSTEIK